MKRPRGRRVALLLASALPVLAEHDDVLVPDNIQNPSMSADSSSSNTQPPSSKRARRSYDGSHTNETLGPLCICVAPSTSEDDLLRLLPWEQEEEEERVRHDHDCLADMTIPFRSQLCEDVMENYVNDSASMETSGAAAASIMDGDEGKEGLMRQSPAAAAAAAATAFDEDDSTTRLASVHVNSTDSSTHSSTGGDSGSLDAANNTLATANATTTPSSLPAAAADTAATLSSPSSTTTSTTNTFMGAVDYASKAAGALILETSPGLDGAANLLTKDKDKYAIADCQWLQEKQQQSHDSTTSTTNNRYFVVIGLSEDILVKRIVLANYERYSSPFREFTVFGSPTADGNWIHCLGNFEMQLQQGKQTFDLQQPVWARYLKFEFKSYHGDEHYCTLSQIMVHGSTVLQGFHEQWEDDAGGAGDKLAAGSDKAVGKGVVDSHDASASSNGGDDMRNETAALHEGEAVGTGNASGEATTSDELVARDGAAQAMTEAQLQVAVPDLASPNGSDPSMKWGALSAASLCLSICRFAQAVAPSWKLDPTKQLPTEVVNDNRQMPESSTEPDRMLTLDLTEHSIFQQVFGRMKTLGFEDAKLEASLTHLRNMKRDITMERSEAKLTKEQSPHAKPISSVTTPAELVEPKHATVPMSVSGDASNRLQALHEMDMELLNLLQRYPSAECLIQLDLVSFKAKFFKSRSGGAGQDPSGATAMEPIFKKLKDEIRGMQAALALHDQYAVASLACYQSIIMELLADMEATRVEFTRRLERLENDANAGFRGLFMMQDVLHSMMAFVASVIVYCLKLVAVEEFGVFISFLRLTLGCSAVIYGMGLFKRRLDCLFTQVKNPATSRSKAVHHVSDDSSSETGEPLQPDNNKDFPSYVLPKPSSGHLSAEACFGDGIGGKAHATSFDLDDNDSLSQM